MNTGLVRCKSIHNFTVKAFVLSFSVSVSRHVLVAVGDLFMIFALVQTKSNLS
uniref:Uncharacterized protein n=1 Tax=Oryza brachyantha TaxID=4533 RepID=J3ND84_ORYBR